MKRIQLFLQYGLFVCTFLFCSWALAQPGSKSVQTDTAERYKLSAGSADGIGKSYMGREIARVMGYQAASWLERSEREQEERTDLLLKVLALKPGMVVADVGAGTGYLSRRMARAVAPTGRVFALDIQPEMISILKRMSSDANFTNIDARLGSEQDVKLPASSIDLAIMVDVYHELAFPHEVLASIVRALKPGGQLVFVEYKAEDPNVPIKYLHKMSESQIKLEAARHPLIWEKTVATLPWQHVVIFRAGKQADRN
ncbi:class I SAM-dependent methyltransferase [Polynucleobacter antarcticus]|uniref:SAM-dependent methyltransferase n=1 Tax=Polynucleobacter antarcticus TaxID=1743162 RepID=A0A6M9PPX4_9BURK|nr:methyltransferase domain-containing protein [Polynucleobacter antarcticus]QKM62431.1 SAM-dependent methyltransferase [Polynucleobacter antarcticus]